MADYKQGEVLLAWLVFSDGQGNKRRPVLVIQDFGDKDLLVVPITSHPSRGERDVALSEWKSAGLKLPSTTRLEKFATIAKSCIERRMGMLSLVDLTRSQKILETIFKQIIVKI